MWGIAVQIRCFYFQQLLVKIYRTNFCSLEKIKLILHLEKIESAMSHRKRHHKEGKLRIFRKKREGHTIIILHGLFGL